MQAKRDFAARVIAARRQSGLDAATALVLSGTDKTSMDAVRASIADMTDGAQRRIQRAGHAQAVRGPVLITAATLCIVAAFAAIALLALRRRRAERISDRRMRESEERFRTLIETSAAIIWTASSAGAFVKRQSSWGAFTGQIEAEYAGFGWSQALHPEDCDVSVAAWRAAVAAHAPFEAEYRMRRADGAWRIMAARGMPILRMRPGCENIPVVVLTARDLDANERRQLDSADRVLSKGETDLRQLAGEIRALTPAAPSGSAAG